MGEATRIVCVPLGAMKELGGRWIGFHLSTQLEGKGVRAKKCDTNMKKLKLEGYLELELLR